MDGDITTRDRRLAAEAAGPEEQASATEPERALTSAEAAAERRRKDPEVVAQIAEEIPRLRRFARAMVRDPALADDLVQECLERALSRLHLWQAGTNLRAWLFTILRNLHINGIRRQQTFVDIDGEVQAGLGGSHGSQVVRLELRDLRRALAKLPTEQREVVLLIGLEGISYAEAADILQVSIGTVKSRLSRGRRALRILMEGGGKADDVEVSLERLSV